jgi:hypothetical protein
MKSTHKVVSEGAPFPDFKVENHGSIFLLRPDTEAAKSWVEEHIGEANGYQPYWPNVVIEPPYVVDIVTGITADGLEVR